MQLFDRPFLAFDRIVADLGRGKAVETGVVSRMHGNQLPLEMGREFRDFEPVACERALHFVAIGLAFRSLVEIEDAPVPTRNLDALVAEASGPAGNGVERVERRGVAGELGQKNGRSLDGLHRLSPGRTTQMMHSFAPKQRKAPSDTSRSGMACALGEGTFHNGMPVHLKATRLTRRPERAMSQTVSGRLKIGLSACFSHADAARSLFTNKTLQYVEQSIAHWLMS